MLNNLINLRITSAVILSAGVAFNCYAENHNAKIQAGDLVIENTFAFPSPPGALAAGGYVTITNTGTNDDMLTGGASSFSEVTEIHEMKMVEGVMKMRELEQGLKIPAGESVTLQPGGLHVMFMQLTQPLVEGESKPGSLTFASAGEVDVEYKVINRSEYVDKHGGKKSHGHMKHSEMKHDEMKHGEEHKKSDH
jgi:copper(I)-binding protein